MKPYFMLIPLLIVLCVVALIGVVATIGREMRLW